MKLLSYSALAASLLAASLLAASLPAAAQTYSTPPLQDFASIPNLTGSSTNNVFLQTVGASAATVGVQSGYKQARVIDAAVNPDTGGGSTPIVVRTKTQAALDVGGNTRAFELNWATANDTTASTAFVRALTAVTLPTNPAPNPPISNTSSLVRPVVDLGGTITITFAVDPGYYASGQSFTAGGTQQGNFDVQVALGIANGVSSTVDPSNANVLGTNGGFGGNAVYFVGNTVDAATRVGGKMIPGSNVQYSGNGTAGGTSVASGAVKFTTLTFNLPTEHSYDPAGSGTTLATSGLGVLDSICFTPVNPTPGQFWNVYIDDVQITPGAAAAAPEPSAWLTLAAGGVGLSGLAARRRSIRTRS